MQQKSFFRRIISRGKKKSSNLKERRNRMVKTFAKFGALLGLIWSIFLFSFPTSSNAAPADYKIEINKRTNYLYLYKNGKVAKTYRVATGKTSKLTPTGTFVIGVKIVKPGWKNIPGGHPKNPLGPRWIGLVVNNDRARTYGIHGTNDPNSIGKHASNGCIRMRNNDVVELYKTIYEGVPVWIHTGTSNKKWRGNANVGLKRFSGKAQVTASQLYVRSGPTTGAFVIGKTKKGTILTITGGTSNWYQIRYNGKTGFVYKPYTKRK